MSEAAQGSGTQADVPADEAGYHQALGNRHVQMIAVGGAIGTGLFLGAGARLQAAGPALALVYLVCGVFAFLVMRALGELVLHRPTSGSFVTYAREFLGEGAAFAAGWMFFLNWGMTGIADITAVALYLHHWPMFADVPQWLAAAGALVVVGAMNLLGVLWFGELEFWFALIKVAALSLFLLVGLVFVGGGFTVAGHAAGLSLVAENGGLFPHGALAALVLVQGVIFAFSGVEIVGTAAGETKDARRVLPRAINGVIWRVALFYVGSVALLVCLMPWSSYRAGESPFVTFFGAIGVPGAGSVMNLVVITAALSSLNSGLFATGRTLRALAEHGSAPRALARMSRQGVPYVGICLALAIYAAGVGLNYFVPAQAFEIVINVASLGVLSTWAFIVLSQMAFRRAVARGTVAAVSFRLPGGVISAVATLAFLGGVLVLMGFDYPNGTGAVAALPLVALALALGWQLAKRANVAKRTRPATPPR